MDIGELIESADRFYGLPFARLERVIEYNRISRRPEDLAHLDRSPERSGSSRRGKGLPLRTEAFRWWSVVPASLDPCR